MSGSIYNFSNGILKDLKTIYETGSKRKNARLRKDSGITHLVEQTQELVISGEKYIKGEGFDEFYRKYFL